ncbi:FitA-like ribbon-helix-helix domain-containing protein [Aquihabitans sp. McL0605]|uniref:FitA-like ribbon-helix-helix domain-containing protein n=1 Tax=Aquihabitans sp. McL0605 TaxID=3415671 RepID=UPI003CF5C8BC
MTNITIRDVPEPVHRTLSARAAKRGQSLQQYLVDTLSQLTVVPTMDEWLEEIDAMHAGWDPSIDRSLDDVAYLEASHEERDARIIEGL